MSAKQLPRFVRDLLSSCPTAGNGVHLWLYRVARLLHGYYPNKLELLRLIQAATEGCGRFVSDNEIIEAITNSEHCAWRSNRPQAKANRPTWPGRDREAIKSIALSGPKLQEFSSMSPVEFHGLARSTEEIIDTLFPGDPLICAGSSPKCFDTRRRELWRGCTSDLSLIVPSPMSARTGRTKTGKMSARCLANTGPRRFLVVEFDFQAKSKDGRDTPDAPLLETLDLAGRNLSDLCAALHLHLSSFAPLALAVHSGGKSVHGWYYAEGQPEEKLRRFMRYAVKIGADPATWTPCQFVRMPDGTRDNGRRQRVHYFNPGVLP